LETNDDRKSVDRTSKVPDPKSVGPIAKPDQWMIGDRNLAEPKGSDPKVVERDLVPCRDQKSDRKPHGPDLKILGLTLISLGSQWVCLTGKTHAAANSGHQSPGIGDVFGLNLEAHPGVHSGHPPPGSDNLVGLTLEVHLHATPGHPSLGTYEPCHPGLTVEELFYSGLLTIATLARNRHPEGITKA
jgi:hypothetical protein